MIMKSTKILTAAVCVFAMAAMVSGGTLVYEIQAFIDGRDLLVLDGNTVQWDHLTYSTVGRHGGQNYPTTLSSWLDGNQMMEQEQWIPQWPENPPAEIRYPATSSVFDGLHPALPVYSDITSITVEKVEGRDIVKLHASPAEENGGKLIIDFDDRIPGGACWYTVRITVGYQGVPVPDVVGMTQADAQSAITSAGFVVGNVTQVYSESVPAGDVISQSPEAGTPADIGSSVDLVISLGRAITVPDITGISQGDAESILYLSELATGTIQTAYDRSVPEQNVLTQSPAAGQIVPVGTVINMVIAGGQGWDDDPFHIWTAEQLNSIGQNPDDWSGYFKLMADIDMSAYTGTQYNIIGNESRHFDGVFDGNGHVISNLNFNTDTAVDYVGLFGFSSNAIIKNLSLVDVTIYTQGSYAGGLVGRQNGGTITNCHTTGWVTADNWSYSYAGGIVGMTEEGVTVIDSSSDCQVTASTYYYQCYAGGLIGWKCGSNLSRCYSMGTAAAFSDQHQAFAGGIAGAAEFGGDIVACYSTVSATATSETLESCVGGLTGWFDDGDINNCYSMGAVTSASANNISFAGGLIGQAGWGSVTKCYSTGAVTANGSNENIMGGLIGSVAYADVIDSLWDMDASGLDYSAGGEGVIGKTTAEMKTLATFTDAGWDFANETVNGTNDIWRMCADDVNYPKLNWESIDGDFACPAGVNSDDLIYFFQRWLFIDCTADNNFCDGADLNASGNVDLADFAIIADHWLEEI